MNMIKFLAVGVGAIFTLFGTLGVSNFVESTDTLRTVFYGSLAASAIFNGLGF